MKINYAAAFVDALILIGVYHVVFILHRSGWWFILAILLMQTTGAYTNKNEIL